MGIDGCIKKQIMMKCFRICLRVLGKTWIPYSRIWTGKNYIKTKDFTDHARVNFEPAYSVMGDEEYNIQNVKMLK